MADGDISVSMQLYVQDIVLKQTYSCKSLFSFVCWRNAGVIPYSYMSPSPSIIAEAYCQLLDMITLTHYADNITERR